MSNPRKLELQRIRRRQFKARFGYSVQGHYGAGRLRQSVLERDGFKCVKCGMTDAEHKAKWDRPITVDHKDKNRKHNTLENLQTLCLSCHGNKDSLDAKKTHCPKGHLLEGTNLRITKGARRCHTCDLIRARIRKGWTVEKAMSEPIAVKFRHKTRPTDRDYRNHALETSQDSLQTPVEASRCLPERL